MYPRTENNSINRQKNLNTNPRKFLEKVQSFGWPVKSGWVQNGGPCPALYPQSWDTDILSILAQDFRGFYALHPLPRPPSAQDMVDTGQLRKYEKAALHPGLGHCWTE